MSSPHRRLRLVTEAAYNAQPASSHGRSGRGSDLRRPSDEDQDDGPAPDTEPGTEVTDNAGTAANSTSVRLRNRWSTPPLIAARVGLVVLILATVVALTIVVTRPSAPAGDHPELAWPDPPEDSDSGGASASQSAADAEQSSAGAGQEANDEPAEGAGTAAGQSDSEATTTVVVHVAGEVHQPGIVELTSGARVHEAVSAAGGPTDRAALEAVNLAAELTDGAHLLIPAEGEEPPAPMDLDGPVDPGGQPGAEQLVDLNTADATTLQTLPGIGPAMAERIIDYRNTEGQFTSVDQLSGVSGVGPATMERLRDLVTV